MDPTQALESMLAAGKDGAMLRYGLGTAYLQRGRLEEALAHLGRAVELDPEYSAAWKAYGQALARAERRDEAGLAFARGIEVAQRRGDVQAAKEMAVFARRLERGGS